jgi:hypothetical protein
VHCGVFEAITISNLLVGHTHDIVDQMFRSDTLASPLRMSLGRRVWRTSRVAVCAR